MFQGRFKGVLIDQDESWLLELSLYVHINPVRVQALGRNKKEQVKGAAWNEFVNVRGDWGRVASYYLARKYGEMTLAEIGTAVGGADYAAVSVMEKRFEKTLMGDQRLVRGSCVECCDVTPPL